MKKKNQKNNSAEKSIFRTAGEAIGALGHEIVEGKDKLVEAAQSLAEKISSPKKPVVKKAASKASPKKAVKKAIKKAKKIAKKVVKKAVKKAAKKSKVAKKK